MAKPQYKILAEIEPELIKKVAAWILEEFELHGNQGWVLASAIVPQVLNEFRAKIPASAPEVYLSKKSVIDAKFVDCLTRIEAMDAANELETILDAAQNREDEEKHGL